jgi:acyl-coenzyme A thioesterase PaaI-like protein
MRKQPNSHHCVICGVRNEAGLKLAFYDTQSDDGVPEVLARFKPRSIHQGYPDRLHGGLAAGVLDETIGRAVNAGNQENDPTVWGVAVELAVRYRRPLPLEVELTARGRITRRQSRIFEGSGEIYLPDGTVAASASGKYVSMPLEAIAEIDPQRLGWRVYPDEKA